MKKDRNNRSARCAVRKAAVWLLIASLLCGCSQQKAVSKPFWPADLSVSLQDAGARESYELEQGMMIYGTAGAAYVESADGEQKEMQGKRLSIMGVGIGDDSRQLFENSNIKEGYAELRCEYQDSETGERSSVRKVYDGSTWDLEEMDAYDCMVMITFYYDSGKWHMLDLTRDRPETHEIVIAVTYDIQGPQGNYGVESGQICGIFCEYY